MLKSMIGWAIFLLFAPALLFAQKNKTPIFKTWVHKQDKSQVYRGYLLELKDSAMVFSTELIPLQNATALDIFPVENVKAIYARRKGSGGTGLIIGLVLGTATGLILYDPPTSNCTNSQNPFCGIASSIAGGVGHSASGILGGIIGGTLGRVIGGTKTKTTILGSLGIYQGRQAELARFVYHF